MKITHQWLRLALSIGACTLAAGVHGQTILGKHPADQVLPGFFGQNGNADTTIQGLNANATMQLDQRLIPSSGWNGGPINDGDGVLTLDSNQRQLFNNVSGLAMETLDWQNRQLLAAYTEGDTTITVDWQNRQLFGAWSSDSALDVPGLALPAGGLALSSSGDSAILTLSTGDGAAGNLTLDDNGFSFDQPVHVNAITAAPSPLGGDGASLTIGAQDGAEGGYNGGGVTLQAGAGTSEGNGGGVTIQGGMGGRGGGAVLLKGGYAGAMHGAVLVGQGDDGQTPARAAFPYGNGRCDFQILGDDGQYYSLRVTVINGVPTLQVVQFQQ